MPNRNGDRGDLPERLAILETWRESAEERIGRLEAYPESQAKWRHDTLNPVIAGVQAQAMEAKNDASDALDSTRELTRALGTVGARVGEIEKTVRGPEGDGGLREAVRSTNTTLAKMAEDLKAKDARQARLAKILLSALGFWILAASPETVGNIAKLVVKAVGK